MSPDSDAANARKEIDRRSTMSTKGKWYVPTENQLPRLTVILGADASFQISAATPEQQAKNVRPVIDDTTRSLGVQASSSHSNEKRAKTTPGASTTITRMT